MLQKNEHVPFVCDDVIPDGLYPYCREVFDAILEAKIPYGRTKREKTDYPICSD